jgi:hypothetical protein
MEANSVPSKKPEYGLIILGNSGTGKSYICNMTIGYERFETGSRREAVTTTVEYHRIDAGYCDLLIYNIPGLIESRQEAIDRNKREIAKAFEQTPISVVMFLCTQVDGQPRPDDIIAFKALKEAYKFPSNSLMFVLNNIPSKRPPTYEGRFFTLLKKMLNPIPISLEDMFYLDTLNSEDNEKFSATRNRLIHFIAEHHEQEQKLQADIIVRSNELRILREAVRRQYLEAEENKQALELQIKQMTKEYEAVRKVQEKRYQDMVFKLEVTRQQAEEEAKGHEFAGVELETLHKEKKTGLKGQCQELWKKVEDERGVFKKVKKCCKIARNELNVKHKSNEDDEEKNFKAQCSIIEDEQESSQKFLVDQLNKAQKKLTKLCEKHTDCSLLRPTAIGAGLGGAAGAVIGGAAGIALGPCAIATAAAGAAGGATIGGISGAIVTLYRSRRK